MAKRKQRGASFGKQSGQQSQARQQSQQRRNMASYTALGVGAILLLCLLVWFSTGGSDAPDTTNDADAIADDFDSSEDETSGDEGSMSGDDSADHSMDEEGDDGFEASSGMEQIDPSEFGLVEGSGELASLDPVERDGYYSEYPDMIIDESSTYEAVLVTERGDMRIRLFADKAPLTVNNFVSLALDGFYDGTMFHRVLADFMAQAGDPSGTGRGGPGYEFGDETDNGLSFDRRGLLAMANAGPGTNGSQFFITFVPTDWLTGNHTIFGELVEGDDVLSSIRLRDPGSDPNPGDIIETIEIYVVEG